MDSRERIFFGSAATLVILHLIAAWAAPATWWGLSHLAAWSKPLALAWTVVALIALWPWMHGRAQSRGKAGASARSQAVSPIRNNPTARPRRAFPGPRVSALLALVMGVVFWLCRERIHLFGDGSLLIRQNGYSETIMRAPVLVRGTYEWVRAAARQGHGAETALATLSVLAGVVAVFALLRLAASLTPDRGGRYLAAALLLTAGTMQVFFGHVEYYAVPAATLALYLWFAVTRLERGAPTWPTWLAWGALVPLHLSTLALLPAQLILTFYEWRAGRRRLLWSGIAAACGFALAVLLPRVAGHKSVALVETTLAGPKRYMGPFFDTATSKHAFGFLSTWHWSSIMNDILLVAPCALLALPWLLRTQRRFDRIQAFLGIAAAGGLALSIAFHRELGPIRDWDLLATNGITLLAFVAACLVRPHPGRQRVVAMMILVAGLHHLVPWVALQARPLATIRWVETVLTHDRTMSPHARGYWWEELAIYHRMLRDETASMRAYENAVKANPADPRYRVGLGNRYAMKGEFARAVECYRDALRRRPDLHAAENNLAWSLARLGVDLDEARMRAHSAIAADSTKADYWSTLGYVEARAGDHAAANVALDRALRIAPKHKQATRIAAALAAGRLVQVSDVEAPVTAP